MKIATALFFTALVCAAQAGIFPNIFGGLVQSAADRVNDLKNNIDHQLQQAEEKLQSAYKEAGDRAQEAYERLEATAESVKDRVKQQVDKIQESVQNQVDKLLEKVEAQGADLSSCKRLVQTFRNVGDDIVAKNIRCVQIQIEDAKDVVTRIYKIGQEGLDVITGIRGRSNECVENMWSIPGQIKAATCLISVGAKSTWALTTKIPAVIMSLIKASSMIATVPGTMSTCTGSIPFAVLVTKSEAVINNVKQCVDDRIAAGNGKNKL